ncbi:MAG TPA: hypothetical protein VF648_08680 [Pyrinomonadaceae bacterium]|jgi:hypothetical protein
MPTPSTPLPPGSLVYRAIRSKGWKSGDNAQIAAFFLKIDREDKPDEEELSVLYQVNCEEGVRCIADANRCFGAFALRVDEIRKAGLEVIYSHDEERPYHASILNVPKNKDGEEDRAIEIADFLATEARIDHHANWKKR